MRKLLHTSGICILCVFLISVCPFTMGVSIASTDADIVTDINSAGDPLVMPGEIIVKFKGGIPDKAIQAINAQHGASIIEISPLGFMRLSIPKGKSEVEVSQSYSKNPNIEYAEPNAICHAVMTPNDMYYHYQWHLYNNEYGGINAEEAWNLSTGEGVIVAVLDTGVAYENYDENNDGTLDYLLAPDLAWTNFVEGWDYVNNDSHPNDDHWHGTHVTGTIAQSTNNSIGAAGVAFGASIMPLKVLDAGGSGSTIDLANAIYYAAINGADVINMSLAYPLWVPVAWLNSVHSAIQSALSMGVTIVAAAGNDGANQVAYPAAFEECIGVGATQYDEMLAPYSNWGSALDLTAPGGNLDLNQNGDGNYDGVFQETINPWTGPLHFTYILAEGTSMASPHVAGVAALVIAAGISDPGDVRSILQNTAEDHGGGGWDVVYGWGIVDAFDAVSAALGTTNTPPVALDDSASTAEGTAVDIYVLTNDSDADGDTLSIHSVTSPTNGTATNHTIYVTYSPDTNFTGTDSFEYTVSDGNGGTDTATVTVTVDPVNDPPVAVDDSDSTLENNNVDIYVLANDSDADGDTLSIHSVTSPTNGTATNHTTYVTYSPDTNFDGTDSFEYTVSDGNGGTDTATVTVTVNAATPMTWSSGDLENGVWSESGNKRGRDGSKDYSYIPDGAISNILNLRVTVKVLNYSNLGSLVTDNVSPYLEAYTGVKKNKMTQIDTPITPTGAGTYCFESNDGNLLSKIVPGKANLIRVYIRSLNEDRKAGADDLVEVDEVWVEIEYQN